MDIAYLILAYKQPTQLMRMIDRLNQPHVHFFIHMDKKYNDIPGAKALLSKYDNVKVISTVKVNWAGFSQVRAELDMLEAAYASGINFKYYFLLSGQDYPIKDNAFLNNFFGGHNEDFIAFHKVSDLDVNYINKFRFFHFYDIAYINPKSAQKIKFLSYLYFGSHKHLRKVMPGRRMYNNMEPYFGATKTALTQDTVKYIIDFTKEHKGFMKFMKYTETPDETFFQTVLLNSERKTNIFEYNKYLEWLRTRKGKELFEPSYASLRYMDWSETGKPKPATLDMSHFHTLEESKELFARKFDERISAELMDAIDEKLLHKEKYVPET